MKLELRENMYVRTKDGYISQYKYYDYNIGEGLIGKLLCIPLSNGTFANIENIKKFSYKIINLIEAGDYVNDEKIINIIPIDICGDEMLDNQHIFSIDGEIFENEIKLVITHEQIEQMSYKIKE